MRKIYHSKNQNITIAETERFYHICGPNALISLLGINTPNGINSSNAKSDWLVNSKQNNFFCTYLQAYSTHNVDDIAEKQTNTFERAFNEKAFNDKLEWSFDLNQDQMTENPSFQILGLNKSEKTLQYINDIIRTSDMMNNLLTPTETFDMPISIKDYKEKINGAFFKKTHSVIFAHNELYLVLTSKANNTSCQDAILKLSVRKIEDGSEREFILNILNNKIPESAGYCKLFLVHSTYMHTHYHKDNFENSNMTMLSYFTEAISRYEEAAKSRN